jgi:hypothetical protein
MFEKILARRVASFAPRDAVEQENAVAEVLQHHLLASLARSGLFSRAEFHGGTMLRIVHGLPRFSEDLDFVLHEADPGFSWAEQLGRAVRDLAAEGIHAETVLRHKADAAVAKALVRFEPDGKLLAAGLPFPRHPRRKVTVKLEVDTGPPSGSRFETVWIGYPVTTAITVQTLGSAFAGKSHALLCREYVKGRDWFDFLWYVDRGVEPNWALLGSALDQTGPWAGAGVRATPGWYVEHLGRVIDGIDWRRAREDVERFLSGRARESLTLWSRELFAFHLDRLARSFGKS